MHQLGSSSPVPCELGNAVRTGELQDSHNDIASGSVVEKPAAASETLANEAMLDIATTESIADMIAETSYARVTAATELDSPPGLDSRSEIVFLRSRKSRVVSNVEFLDHDIIMEQDDAEQDDAEHDPEDDIEEEETIHENKKKPDPILINSTGPPSPTLPRIDSKRPLDDDTCADDSHLHVESKKIAALVSEETPFQSETMEIDEKQQDISMPLNLNVNAGLHTDLRPSQETPCSDTTDPSSAHSLAFNISLSSAHSSSSSSTFLPSTTVDSQREQSSQSTIQPLLHHNLTWSVAAQEGYRISNPYTRAQTKLHDHIEDVHFPAMADQPLPFTYDNETGDYPRLARSLMASNGAKVFIIADGHGGAAAPRFFASRLAHDLLLLLDSREWDLSELDHRSSLSSDICAIFKLLDVEYASMKVAEYRAWMDAGMMPHNKPLDDGCTMVVNIVMTEWIVNCNVGDSRTVIGAKFPWLAHGNNSNLEQGKVNPAANENSNGSGTSQWIQLFASDDHNMMHPEKVARIHGNGGKFLDPQGTSFMSVDIQPVSIRGMKPYTELNGSRIFRPLSSSIRAVGCSHRRTLNLTATMGDLLFKIEPAILSSLPDIRFIKLEPGMDYVLVAATDGVWDHMCIQYPPAAQNDKVLDFITKAVQSVATPTPSQPATTNTSNVTTAIHSPSASTTLDNTLTPSVYNIDLEPTELPSLTLSSTTDLGNSFSALPPLMFPASPLPASPAHTLIPHTSTSTEQNAFTTAKSTTSSSDCISELSTLSHTSSMNPLFDAVTYCAQALVRREVDPLLGQYKDHGLFVPMLGRYDDATAMILYFSQQVPNGDILPVR
ncbi:hypothetical protein QVD99_004104 [Batrachochytrium dendrobatidis]|nr:hypothetical protein QVD99_004104 [Batrachochytrium dendrobatidis]